MANEDDQLEALVRATDLLPASGEPLELARRFLAHALAAFRADAGILRFSTQGEPVVVCENTSTEAGAQLAATLLDELREKDALFGSWNGSDRDADSPRWNRLLGARAGSPEREALVILAYSDERAPVPATARMLQVMTRNAAVAVENAFLHGETRRQAERLAVQADQMDRIAQALEHHSREMERALAARSRFFTIMSHELRTPINAILGYNQLLLQGAYGNLSEAQVEAANRVRGSAEQLLRLVDDVLDFSKIDAGVLDVNWCETDIASLALSAATAIEATARLKGLRFEVDCPTDLPFIRTDPDRVRQILLNLLANAVKFTSSGTISLSVRQEPAAQEPTPGGPRPGEAGWIALRVQDTGIGIPAEHLENVFGEFIQVASTSQGRSHGAGLGLAISRRLAHLLGGELVVQSQLGVTTTFSLLLPSPAPLIESAAADG